ncbi:MAG: methyltransferase domain-containing protein [Bacteroidales bacterium]
MKKKNYYKQVEDYYNEDAADFDQRYWENPVLQIIRQDFREEVKRHTFKNMLEIGYGTGLDLVHFAKTHPGVSVAGIDISSRMHDIAGNRIRQENLRNAYAVEGSVEDLEKLFPGEKFDMIYVFFGALNTVDDLECAARILKNFSSPGGILVLSFVNKYYLAGIFLELLKGRFFSAFSRLKPVWGGYSPTKFLPSRCYRPGEIRRFFSDFRLIKRKGYSIVHPAWYYRKLYNLMGRRISRFAWKADRLLNKTPLWRFGEYFLFVFQNPDNID